MDWLKSILTEDTSCVDSAVDVALALKCSGFCFSFPLFGISGILSDIRSLRIRQSTGDAATYVHPAGADVVGAGASAEMGTNFQLYYWSSSSSWANRSPCLKSCPFLDFRHNATTFIPNLVHL